jgi:Bacterial Ig-like domain (group 2)
MLSGEVRSHSRKLITGKNSETFRFLRCLLSIACFTALLSSCSTPSLRTISITPATGAAVLTSQDQTVQFHAVGSYQQGSHPPTTQDITNSVTWSSSAPSVATIDATGLATAVGSGTTTITATGAGAFGAIQGTSSVQVNLSAAPPTGLSSISIIPSTQSITVLGQTAKFVAIGNFTGVSPATQDLTTQATWSSSAPGVATISSGASGGIATAIGPGTATITATSQSSDGAAIVGTATISISSSAASGLTAISIIPTSQTVTTAGETSQYIAIGTFSGVTPATQDITNSPNLKWVSSDVAVATINSSGLATQAGSGTTAITAEWNQTGSSVITGAATFTSTTSGTVTLPTLSIYKVGNGAATTTSIITTSPAPTPPPLSCGTGTNCTGYFPLGTTVTITVSPVPSDFGGWSSNCTPVSGNPGSCTVTLNGNQAVGAIFY